MTKPSQPVRVQPMKLNDLLQRAGLPPAGSMSGVMVRGISDDSRRCAAGSCYVAIAGHRADGHAFIDQAICAGATAIVAQHPVDVPPGVALIIAPDAREAAARLAGAFYGLLDAAAPWPNGSRDRGRRQRPRLIGVTGTNGKSTTCYFIRSVLQAAGQKAGLMGTIEYDLIRRKAPSTLTTPGPIELAAMIAECADAGGDAVAMEVSSHALDQGRAAGLAFDVGVFTNLTGDHLDYHCTTDAYLAAKKRLFDDLSPNAFAVVNRDDAASQAIVQDTWAGVQTYGLSGNGDAGALLRGESAEGTSLELRIGPACFPVRLRLPGLYNVSNAMAAALACRCLGVDVESIRHGLESLRYVPGRLQRVDAAGLGFSVFVDYAHTDDALANVLACLRPLARGQLHVVFGCGGDRDRTKRPRMARVAAELADRIVVTSDNPRTEDPQSIIDQIMTGFSRDDLPRVKLDVDRRQAIRDAIQLAEEGDIVLIAGKGHETYQLVGGQTLHFDDCEEAAWAISARRKGAIACAG